MKTILVPVDFSPATAPVVTAAEDFARGIGARLVLVHVTEPVVGLIDYAVVAISTARVTDAMVQHALTHLAELKAGVEQAGIVAETVHVVGSPVPEIVEQARKQVADYIVIGSHGHTAFYDLLVGSTASGVLKRATCPVVVVPIGVLQHRGAAAGAGGKTGR